MAIKSHHIRSKLITLLAVMVILFAVLFSVFRMLVPYITDYGDDIEAEISRQLKLPVEIVSVDADIVWLLPRLKLLDVNFYDPDNYKLFFTFG